MRLFSEHPHATGGENGHSPESSGSDSGREALRLRLRLYCDRHISEQVVATPADLDRRFTAFFIAAHRDGLVEAQHDPEILARLFIALLANLDLRRTSGAPTHELRHIAAASIAFIV